MDALFEEGFTSENLDVCYSRGNIENALAYVKAIEEKNSKALQTSRDFQNNPLSTTLQVSVDYYLTGPSASASTPLLNRNFTAKDRVNFLIMCWPMLGVTSLLFILYSAFPPLIFVGFWICLKHATLGRFVGNFSVPVSCEGFLIMTEFSLILTTILSCYVVAVVDGMLVGVLA